MSHITQVKLKSLINYEPASGKFTYIITSANAYYKAGDEAGYITSNGYRQLRIEGRDYQAHRLAFLYMTGSMPILIDHKDRVRDNNEWLNLRDASRGLNRYNSKLNDNSTSGYTGVLYDINAKRWRAGISFKGKRYNLGTFLNKESAIIARKQGEEKYYD